MHRHEAEADQERSRQILIVDDDPDVLSGLAAVMAQIGWEVVTAATGREALVEFGRSNPDAVLLDVMLPDLSGTEVLDHIKSYSETTPVVMMSGVGTIDMAVQAMRLGAEHFIAKPCDIDTLELILARATSAIDMRRQLESLRRRDRGETLLAGVSPAIREIDRVIHRVSDAGAPVLLQGESGTGKGVVARMIHDVSRRAAAPYVDLNCAALSRELLESELFGHERGAFTGAHAAKTGLFEIAHGGTLFLDEIGELELPLQARLLKALEQKSFRRVGGVRDIHVDVRLIAATNRDLQEDVRDGRFRRDLYYRLNVVSIVIPPLRERREDIPLLAELLIQKLSAEMGLPRARLSERAVERLTTYPWPGNVRELKNVIERALLLSPSDTISAAQLQLGQAESQEPSRELSEESIRPLDEVVAEYVQRAVDATGGNMRRAARLLGISPSTLYARLKK